MKKRILAVVLTLAMVLSLVPMTALAIEDGGTDMSGSCGAEGSDVKWKLTVNNNDAENPTYTLTISGNGDMCDLNEYTAQPWYSFAGSITSVVVGDGVTAIGAHAFQYLSNLSLVKIESTKIKTIKNAAFYGCANLEELDFSGCTVLTSIGNSALGNCTKLATIKFPNSLVTIGQQVFYKDTALKTIQLPDSLEELGYQVFQLSGLETIKLPANISTLGTGTFKGCSNLKVADLSACQKVTSLPAEMFNTCSALEEVSFPAGLESIAEGGFKNCTALKTVDLSNCLKLTAIPKQTFSGCKALTSVKLPEGLTTVGENAFYQTRLTQIIIPESVEAIETLAFCQYQMSSTCPAVVILGKPTIANGAFNNLADGCVFYLSNSELSIRQANGASSIYTWNLGAVAYTNGGVFSDDTTFSSKTLANPQKELYTFDGWYKSSDFSGDKVSSVEKDSGKNYYPVYYAKWNSTITFDANGGSLPEGTESTITVEEGKIISTASQDYTLPIPTKGDSAFAGWNTAADGSGTFVTDSTVPTGNMTLYAIWGTTAGSYTLLPIGDQTYTGSIIEPDVHMVDGNGTKVIADGVTYVNNINAGTATATVTIGETEYSVSFTIKPKSVTKPTEDANVYTYTGSEQTYVVVVSADYTVSDATQTNAGTYTVTVALNDKANTTWTDNTTNDLTFTFTIGKADMELTFADANVSKTTGSAAFTNALSGVKENATISYSSSDESVATVASTGAVTIKGTGSTTITATAVETSNYNKATASYTLTVSAQPVVGPTIPIAQTYTISTPRVSNGTVAASISSASKGATVTINVTPDKDYELASLTVTDANGNRIPVKQVSDNKFTFTMPASKVTVSASFSKVVKTLPFTDVSANDYFFDAVVWAVENGVTYGNSATTFGVGVTCNRADAVTFIWRAYGCPAPKNRENPFTDVADSAYYADAVLWAVENGITVGTSATTFSPLESCRREHIVTFLYRAAGSPTVSHSSGFSDVADSAYYANAVTWAAENGITVGAGSATTFGPTQNCFREQIVTFLYRNLAE